MFKFSYILSQDCPCTSIMFKPILIFIPVGQAQQKFSAIIFFRWSWRLSVLCYQLICDVLLIRRFFWIWKMFVRYFLVKIIINSSLLRQNIRSQVSWEDCFVIWTVLGVSKWKWPGLPRISKIISWGLHLSRCIVPRKTDLIEPPISSQSKCFHQNLSDIRTLSPVSILNSPVKKISD